MKAETFLQDLMTSYHIEGWKSLRDEARLDLARCQLLTNKHKYGSSDISRVIDLLKTPLSDH